ncbi:gamma-aminobutyric acid receptor subunit theta isoform X5 [Toxorhynchites rutilus septentrionalis]|uniref:gamma-aminobutyric acid receptor subunit theta isoform X5 n=1 Tax=Toxorhynchites rutilus septentrionalis TaxID=329112 RepID=UPI00247851E6|nr:gamma-aminobutyric acid receptor subunit theta isoform X5 [Toxorhynchites rutilus septentrionalis]
MVAGITCKRCPNMGFSCENTHHRTPVSEQSWIETICSDQPKAPPPHYRSCSKRKVNIRNEYTPLTSEHQFGGETTPATKASRHILHYPFNLFHPFHSSSLQYTTIILDKLSQFITKYVAAKSGSILKATPSCCNLNTHPLSLAGTPVRLHSCEIGSNPFPVRPSQPDATENQKPSPFPHTYLSKAASEDCSSASSPLSSSFCDPSITPVAYVGGSTATTTGCTIQQPSSPLLPSESRSSALLLLSPPSLDASTLPSSSHRISNRQLPHPAAASHPHQSTSNSTSSVTTTTTTIKPASSHYLVRHSLCLYAASSVILALCYLTIPTVASETPHTMRGKTRFTEGKSDKEILDHLLKGSRYDKRLLPPVDDADFCCGMQNPEMAKHMPDTRVPGRPQNRGSLTVNVSVLLLSLASPDESSLKYEVEFLLQQQWYDPRLRYADQSQYEFLNAIHHHEDIWLPDTYFIMHGDFKDPIIPMHFALRIYRNGTINYLMRRHLILSCQGRLNIFPFDDPLCSFALESISYEQSAIRYVWKNDEDTLRKSPSLTTLNAYLIQNQTITCPIKASWRAEGQSLSEEDEEFLCNLCQRRFEEQGNYSCLKVDLIFTRDRAFYFTTVFIPGIILVTSSFITFWLEWNAVPARSMIGVTTMLNFFTTSNGFRSTLPVVSNLTAMNVWDGVCMCFIYASLLEFVCVNYVGRKRPLHNVVYRPGENPVTQRLPAVLNRIGIILASPLTSRIFSETIENEFHMAIAAEKSKTAATQPGAAISASPATSSSADATPDSAAAAPYQHPVATVADTIASIAESESFNGNDRTPQSLLSTATPSSSRPTSVLMEEGIGVDIATADAPKTRPRTLRQATVETKVNEIGVMETSFGVKKRESGGPNEIVACTSCAGGTSPCTHSANNGCATETCFVQVRKKEPPHPIRVAKTIDVIARITFPSAYAVFLIFFFIHYKGFS